MSHEEELSELECVIDSYCREAVSCGFELRAGGGGESCPLAAIAFVQKLDNWMSVELAPFGSCLGFFGRAFDGNSNLGLTGPIAEAYAMGARFRERVLAGEYVR